MAVYVMWAEGSDLYKVGVAQDPAARLVKLQTGCPFPLSVVAQIEGGRAEERRVHAALHARWARGEWFELDRPPTAQELAELSVYVAPAPIVESLPVEDPGDPVGIKEIADRLYVKRRTVDQWLQRGILPAPRWTVGGRPAWNWPDIKEWALTTGRDENPAKSADLEEF